MSLNFDAWVNGSPGVISHPMRAASVWRMIQRIPTSIVIDRDGEELTAQTVLITFTRKSVTDSPTDAGGRAEQIDAYVFGVIDHLTLPDADLKPGDTFVHDNRLYTITAVTAPPGFKEATAKRSDT